MNNASKVLGTMLGVCLICSGCATVISEKVLSKANRHISVTAVREASENYKGQLVIWGGEIVGAKNREEGTTIEILQKPTNRSLRPKEVDVSGGRFLAIYDGYLDVAIYERGREVTVAGQIQGTRVLPLGEIEYRYPVIDVEEIHLWEPIKETAEYPYRYYPHRYYPPPWWYW